MKSKTQSADNIPSRLFKSQKAWATWLKKNHRKNPGLWLRFAKKSSGLRCVNYQEAIEVALCYGWIDGQARPENEQTWSQRFVPRSPKSLWSKINRKKAQALIANGKMKAAGLAAIKAAKKEGRWKSAYDSPSKAKVPDDLQAALDAHPEAKAFFETLNRQNRYAILWRIQTAKKVETRARKIQEYIEMLERSDTIHP